MSEHVFYAKGRSQANTRKVTLSAPQLLISKPPTKQKRVKMRVTMGLSTQKQAGTPEWIAAAHEFVAKQHDKVTPQVDFKGMDITFATENLFNDGKLQMDKCQMRGFSIEEQGGEEEPEVVLAFLVYAPFSTALWEYLGQMAGEEVRATFTQSAMTEPESDAAELEMSADDPDPDDPDEDDDDDADEEDDADDADAQESSVQ